MKRLGVISIALLGLATSAWAAGVTQTLKFTVLKSDLGGYKATPSPGWYQDFVVKLATTDANTKSKTDPKFLVVARSYNFDNPPTTLPDPNFITLIGPIGTILQREQLPSTFTVNAADCTMGRINDIGDFVNDGCPSWEIGEVYALKANPNRMIISGSLFRQSLPTRRLSYVLDFTAAVGSPDRWTLLDDRSSNAIHRGTVFQSYDEVSTNKTWMIAETNDAFSVYTIVNK